MTPRDYNAAQMQAGRLTLSHVTELVARWQAANGLEVDGMAGPLTITSIDRTLAPKPFLACPLPVLADTRRAQITSGFRQPDRPDHDGLDWFYPWRAGDKPDFAGDHGAEGRNADGTPHWVVPFGVYAVAAASGVVTHAADSPTGHVVWIDHGNGLRSGYFHLRDTGMWQVGQQIKTGAMIGLVGDNPADIDGRHLHFELSLVETYAPLDPTPYLLQP